jgi:hypothetical protein
MKTANIHEAKTQLSKLIEQAIKGEDVNAIYLSHNSASSLDLLNLRKM